MRKIYTFFIFAALALSLSCEKEDVAPDTQEESTPVVASFQAMVADSYRVLYNADGYLNEINSGVIVNFTSTSTGNPSDEDIAWALTWIDADTSQAITKTIYPTDGVAFMRFVDPGAYNITMTAEDSEISYLSYIYVVESVSEDVIPDDEDGETDTTITITDTFLAAAGWDTSFEDTSIGYWKNFSWGGVYNMNTISSSSTRAKTGSKSTYFEIQSNGGMAGGFRDPDGYQFTIPVVTGTTYSVGFWIYIETMPADANLSVVFGGNKSGYIPVTDLLTTELNTWVYKITNVTATGDDIVDLLLFSTLEASEGGEFKFYIDDIAMAEYDPDLLTTPDSGDSGSGDVEAGDNDTYLATAGWDTSFENSALGYWKNFSWGGVYNMNTISSSTAQAKTGSYSTYFSLESHGGMAGGFRDASGYQITIPVVSGESYVVGFWMYIETMPSDANLSVVFGSNMSDYMSVDFLSDELNTWVYKTVTVTAKGSNINDLLLFSDLSLAAVGDGEFNFYIDDIGMIDAE